MGGAGGTPSTCPYRDAVLADAPLAYWRLGERVGPDVLDASGNMRAGVYVNGVELGAPGAVGCGDTAATFDGTNQAVMADSSFLFGGSVPFSLEVWIDAPAVDAIAQVLGQMQDDVYVFDGYALFADDENTWFERAHDMVGESAYGPPLGIGYTHVVATFDGVTLQLWMNGVLTASVPSPTQIPDHPQPFVLGRRYDAQYPFLGTIDELSLYDRALTSAEVLSHFAAATR
jgi:hypothetical protein